MPCRIKSGKGWSEFSWRCPGMPLDNAAVPCPKSRHSGYLLMLLEYFFLTFYCLTAHCHATDTSWISWDLVDYNEHVWPHSPECRWTGVPDPQRVIQSFRIAWPESLSNLRPREESLRPLRSTITKTQRCPDSVMGRGLIKLMTKLILDEFMIWGQFDHFH